MAPLARFVARVRYAMRSSRSVLKFVLDCMQASASNLRVSCSVLRCRQARRVSALAGPGEVLVSQTVHDLVAGSEISFDDHGVQQLKGVPGEWRIYAVAGI